MWLAVIAVVVLVLFVTQRKNMMRIFAAIGAQFGKLARMIWRADPIAVLQAEVDRSTEEINQATEGLEIYRGKVADYNRRVTEGEKKKAQLTAKIKALLAAGDETRAASYAVTLNETETKLVRDKEKLTGYETNYQNNLTKLKHAKDKIRSAQERVHTYKADLDLSRADAEAAKLATKFNINTNSLDGLGEVEAEIQRQIDNNQAKAHVAHDLSSDGLAEIEEEELLKKQQAQDVLAKFKAEMGGRN